MSVPDVQVRRNRAKLLLITALFMLPPIAAWLAWQYLDAGGVRSTTNAGTLVTPAGSWPRDRTIFGWNTAAGSWTSSRPTILELAWWVIVPAKGRQYS